jgi:hypothetical protein
MKELEDAMGSIDTKLLTQEALQTMMRAAQSGDIKKIKEISAEQERMRQFQPPAPVYAPPPPPDPQMIFHNNVQRLRELPDNYRSIPCKNFHSPMGCMRNEFCHFIHLAEYQGNFLTPLPAPL